MMAGLLSSPGVAAVAGTGCNTAGQWWNKTSLNVETVSPFGAVSDEYTVLITMRDIIRVYQRDCQSTMLLDRPLWGLDGESFHLQVL